MASRKLEVQIVGDASSLSRAFGQASKSSSSFGRTVGGAFSVLSKTALVGGAAVATGLGAAIKAAGNFEQSLNTFQAVSQASGKQMSAIRSEAIRLGADLTLPATSAKDAADAMTELTKAGLSVTDTMAAAKGVLQLSAAAQIDNAQAATITANALNAFSLKGRDAGKVADLLAAASVAASGEITDMADALKQTSATAAQAHQSIGDVVTAIGEMANKGILGGMAGSALQQMFLKLESPTKKGAETMKQFGLSIYDTQGKMLPLRTLVAEFSAKLGGLSDKQRNAAMNTLFGSRAIKAANIVLLGGAKAWDKMHDAVSRTGAAQDLAQAKMKGFKGALQGMQSQLETAAILVGSALLPSATKVVNSINQLLGNVMAAHTFKAKMHVAWDFGTGIKDALQKAWSGAQTGTIATHNTSGAGMSKGIQGQIEAALSGMDWTHVGEMISAGIAAGITAGGKMAKQLVTVVTQVMGSIDWNTLGRTAGPGLAAALVSAFATIMDPSFWIKNWDLALAVGLAAFGGAFGKIGGKLGEMLAPMLRKPFEDAILAVAGVVERVSPKIGEALLKGLLKLPSLVGAPLKALGTVVKNTFDRLGTIAKFTIKVLGIDAVIRGIASLATKVAAKIREVVSHLLSFQGGWKAAAVKLGLAIALGVPLGMVSLAAAVGSHLAKIAGTIASRVGGIRGAATKLGLAIALGVPAGMAGIAGKVNAKLSAIAGVIAGIAEAAFGWATSVGSSIISGIVSGLKGLAGSVAHKIHSGLSAGVHAAGGLLHGSGEFQWVKHIIGEAMVAGVIAGLNGLQGGVQASLVGSLGKAVKAAQAEVNKLTAQMAAAQARATDKQNREQLAAAEKQVAAAKKSGKGMADAMKALADAQNAIADTAAQKALDKAQKNLDRVQAQYDKAKAAADAFKQAMADRRQAVKDTLSGIADMISSEASGIGLSLTKVFDGNDIAAAGVRIAQINKLFKKPIKINRAELDAEMAKLVQGTQDGLDAMKATIDENRTKVADAWSAFGSHVEAVFEKDVVNRFQDGLDKLADALDTKTLEDTIKKNTAALDAAASVDPKLASMFRAQIELWKQYYADLAAGNFDGAAKLQDSLIAGQDAIDNYLASLPDDQKQAAQAIIDAGGSIIDAVKTLGEKTTAAAVKSWQDLTSQQHDTIMAAIASAQADVDSGKKTLPEAMAGLKTVLLANGLSDADAEGLLHDPIATALNDALTALNTSVNLFIIALDQFAIATGTETPALHAAAEAARAALVDPLNQAATDAEAAAVRFAAAVSSMEASAHQAAINNNNGGAAGTGGWTAGFAQGGEVFKKQLAWVGEAGHEFIVPANKIPSGMRSMVEPFLRSLIHGHPIAMGSGGGVTPKIGSLSGFLGPQYGASAFATGADKTVQAVMAGGQTVEVHNHFPNFVGDRRDLQRIMDQDAQRRYARNR